MLRLTCYYFPQAPLPVPSQAIVQSDIPAKITGKGVVVIKEMVTSLKGLLLVLQIATLALNITIFSNSIAGMPGENNN